MDTMVATQFDTAEAKPDAAPSRPRIASSLIRRAKAGDRQALNDIFRQFVPADEALEMVEYLGFHGLIFGRHSLGCLTRKRVADVTLGMFGEVIYQDAYLEYCNSSVVVQPSKLWLYLYVGFAVALGVAASWWIEHFAAMASGSAGFALAVAFLLGAPLTLLLMNIVVRIYYALRKCGLVVWCKEGIGVYVFTDRKHLGRARGLLQSLSVMRDQRIASIGHG